MKKIIEIRPGEGGEDAQIFVKELYNSYIKMCIKNNWKYDWLTEKPSDKGLYFISFSIFGDNCNKLTNEAGGHRIQRIPPTEKKGRVHTSSVTVSVLDEFSEINDTYSEKDFKIEWFSGTGKGGQNRNKTQNCCRIIHIPTGIIKQSQNRKREISYKEAKNSIISELNSIKYNEYKNSYDLIRKNQIGSGMRSDKIRTYQFQNNKVTDHITNKISTCSNIMKGNFHLLW